MNILCNASLTISIIGIVISTFAVLVSLLVYFYNISKHNYEQLKINYMQIWENLNNLTNFVTTCYLDFKIGVYEIFEYNVQDKEFAQKYYDFQKSLNALQIKYQQIYFNQIKYIDFLYKTNKSEKNNNLHSWLNKVVNHYYSLIKENCILRLDILNSCLECAKNNDKKSVLKLLDRYYENLYEVYIISESLLPLIKNMIMGFNRVYSRKSVMRFHSNSKILKIIDKEGMSIVNDGIDDAIYKHNFEKLNKNYYSDSYNIKHQLVNEKAEFIQFVNELNIRVKNKMK